MTNLNSSSATKTGFSILELAQRVLDAAIIALTGFLAHALFFNSLTPSNDYALIVLSAALLALLVFPLFGLYRSWRGLLLLELAGNLLAAWAMTFLLLALLLFAFKMGHAYSRAWFFSWVGLAALGLILSRVAVYFLLYLVRRRGLNIKRVAIIGEGKIADELARRAEDASWTGFKIVARFSKERTPDAGYHPLPTLATCIQELAIDEIWIALPLREEDVIKEVLHALRHETVNIRFSPDISSLRLINHHVSTLLGLPVINLRASPMSGTNRLIKALEDYILAGLFLLIASPLMLVIALGIKLTSPGPLLFKQRRHGWGGKEFYVYKFRTMTADESEDKVHQATRNDPRVTRFGAFLRRTSLDELPQLVNVLRGDMSLVGPRPHAVQHNEFYKDKIDSYMLRHKVKPGITGWAQVNGLRGETETIEKMRERIEYDLYYIENWSLCFDLKIIALTFLRMFTDKNAY